MQTDSQNNKIRKNQRKGRKILPLNYIMSSVELCRMGTHELGLDGSLGHQRSVGHVLPASTYRIYSVRKRTIHLLHAF